jgi:hypothetical protein
LEPMDSVFNSGLTKDIRLDNFIYEYGNRCVANR